MGSSAEKPYIPSFDELCAAEQLGMIHIRPDEIEQPSMANAWGIFIEAVESYETGEHVDAEQVTKAYDHLEEVTGIIQDQFGTLDLGGQTKFVASDGRVIMNNLFGPNSF